VQVRRRAQPILVGVCSVSSSSGLTAKLRRPWPAQPAGDTAVATEMCTRLRCTGQGLRNWRTRWACTGSGESIQSARRCVITAQLFLQQRAFLGTSSCSPCACRLAHEMQHVVRSMMCKPNWVATIACRTNLYAHSNTFNFGSSCMANSCVRSMLDEQRPNVIRLHGSLQREPAASRHSVAPTIKASC